MEEPLEAMKTEILVRIEKVAQDLRVVAEGVENLVEKSGAAIGAQEQLEQIVQDHDLRIRALELASRKSAKRQLPRSGPAVVSRETKRNRGR